MGQYRIDEVLAAMPRFDPPALDTLVHGVFLSEYGDVDALRWEAARGRAIVVALWGLAQGVDVGDRSTASECQKTLSRLLSVG